MASAGETHERPDHALPHPIGGPGDHADPARRARRCRSARRVGVFNMALEGQMLVGAFAAIVGSYFTQSATGGVAAAILAAMIFSLILAYGATIFRGDQVVICIGMNLLASGLTAYLLRVLFGVSGIVQRSGDRQPRQDSSSRPCRTFRSSAGASRSQTFVTWIAWALVAIVSIASVPHAARPATARRRRAAGRRRDVGRRRAPPTASRPSSSAGRLTALPARSSRLARSASSPRT